MARSTKPLSPWAQDQRRIRRLRAKVRAQWDRAEGWMRASNQGWAVANNLFEELKPHLAPDRLEAWKKILENQPF